VQGNGLTRKVQGNKAKVVAAGYTDGKTVDDATVEPKDGNVTRRRLLFHASI
jgi:hypothetical protein